MSQVNQEELGLKIIDLLEEEYPADPVTGEAPLEEIVETLLKLVAILEITIQQRASNG